ncbi:hypothetical protein AAF712_014388 [Marasmius tenuissimus]|uniref:DUF6535 domain-containing protein n=1 Tax=Marasmius tenuissimus TaxID=585030 RepID=A0ABR2ZDC7_9AGAR
MLTVGGLVQRMNPVVMHSSEKPTNTTGMWHKDEIQIVQMNVWKEQIKTLLIFAGLLSAVVTAFILESSKYLRGNSVRTRVILLEEISRQLVGEVKPVEHASPSPSNIRIDALWMLSLLLSLATCALGLRCRRSIQQYRSRRHNPANGMFSPESGRAPISHILDMLTRLLTLALLFFFAGLAEFGWRIVVQVVPTAFG